MDAVIGLWIAAVLDAVTAPNNTAVSSPPTLPPDPSPPIRPLWSVPVQIGATHNGDTALAIGVRPELIFATATLDPRFGFGGFVELGALTSDPILDGGITVVRYGNVVSIAASLGAGAQIVDEATHTHVTASLFVGVRPYLALGPFDFPVGFRLDFRPGMDGLPPALTISFSVDTIASAFALYGTAMFVRGTVSPRR